MYLKMIGSLMVIGATTLYGFHMGNSYIERIKQLKELKKVLIILNGDIRYNNTPIRQAIYNLSQKTETTFKDFFRWIADEMMKNPTKDISDAWSDSVKTNIIDILSLSKTDIINLDDFGKNIGNLDKESQQDTFDGYIQSIDLDIDELQQDQKNKVKLYKTLGIMAGLFITVIIV